MTKARKPPGRIACVGASAGGLEALTEFLRALPGDIDMGFVLIQHLEPLHKSALAEILGRETSLDIREARNNAEVEPAHVYVIPPNTLLSISGGRLRLTSRLKRRAEGRYLPIDFFLASLAGDQGEKAVGVILSGTGSDGTRGAQAVKEAGGLVFAQNERTAKYFGMPGSVIAAGSADFVLPPAGIARKLAGLKAAGAPGAGERPPGPGPKETLDRILLLLRDLTGVDFLHYKHTTISRRIAKRMTLHNLAKYSSYYNFLRTNPAEAELLRKDLLISVTSFFREPGTFAVLKKKVFPLLAVRRRPQNPVRLWVPACSSGEEVYSLAIALCEFLEERNLKPYLQVFGTDLSEAVIAKARAGFYPEEISALVSPERLRRFFTKTPAGGYKIAKHVRDLCIFARHDILASPPLSNMDLVSCRNLLIYLDPVLQRKALATLHYALKPAGFLALSSAESVSAAPGLFTAVDPKRKVYTRHPAYGKPAPAARPAELFAAAGARGPAGKAAPGRTRRKAAAAAAGKPGARKEAPPAPYAGDDIGKLKKEFARTVERLNALNEDKDTFNEELKAANEEIQSSNEELQSTNEELETSKEELQSTNEELLTLNEELQNKNEELTRLNSDLNNVFASTNIPLIIVGGDLRIKRFTPTARKVMNLIPSDLGRPIGDIRPNLAVPDLEKMILEVVEDMVPKEAEVRDGEGRWHSVHVRPYRTLDNRIDGALIALYDIDAMKRVQEASHLALDYVRDVIDTMREPLALLDKDARVLTVNRSFREVFGLAGQKAERRRLYELNDGQWDLPRVRELLGKILRGGTRDNFELSFDLPGAGRKTMLLNARLVKPAGDAPLILLVIEDATERKKADAIIKRDNAGLEKIVRERSRELLDLQGKLERSKRLSDIGTLAATVAHELRNTLAAINTAAYNIRRNAKHPRALASLANIARKIAEGERIIGNVLSYSRIKTSRFEAVDLNALLAVCVEEAKERARGRSITFSSALAPTGGLRLEADPVQLNEVFSNLLNNALDSIDKDAGTISLETGLGDAQVSVSVRDNGEGIAGEDLKRTLDPFYTTKAKGTGLGLAVCSQILLLHDGKIELESEKGKGTTARVTLPLRRRIDA
ncbi:MAG: PAS domain-containing protein [Elusimicrobia bacterium]|nr:PAS domain-containing protein [Elusimicrobiota bacterium]